MNARFAQRQFRSRRPVTKPLARGDIGQGVAASRPSASTSARQTPFWPFQAGRRTSASCRFDHRGDSLSSVLSALCFWSEGDAGTPRHAPRGGALGDRRISRTFRQRAVSCSLSRLSPPARPSRRPGYSARPINTKTSWRRSCGPCWTMPGSRPRDAASSSAGRCGSPAARPTIISRSLRYRKAFEALGIAHAKIETSRSAAAHYASLRACLATARY